MIAYVADSSPAILADLSQPPMEAADAYRWVVGLDGIKDAGSVTLVMVPLIAEERDPRGAR